MVEWYLSVSTQVLHIVVHPFWMMRGSFWVSLFVFVLFIWNEHPKITGYKVIPAFMPFTFSYDPCCSSKTLWLPGWLQRYCCSPLTEKTFKWLAPGGFSQACFPHDCYWIWSLFKSASVPVLPVLHSPSPLTQRRKAAGETDFPLVLHA